MAVATPSFSFVPQDISGTVLPFLLGGGAPQANGLVVNIYLQMAFAIHLVSLGHHDLLNELVDDLRRQLRQPRHLSGPLNKMLNALIAHERAMNLASNVVVDMQMEGVQISLEPSPTDLRGLTHRELGDHTDTLALLMEAPNPAQGRCVTAPMRRSS